MTTKSPARQSGVTLVELMVGLVVSMIVVLAMLAVYKTTAKVSADAGQGATTDRQRLSGFFAAQKILLGAGYGIDTPSFGNELVVLAGATLSDSGNISGTKASLPADGNALIWGTKLDGTYKCQGLYAPRDGGLIRLQETSCSSAANYATIAWTTITLIEDTRSVQISAKTATGCKSFGLAGEGGLWTTLSTTNSIEGSNAAVSTSTCLINFPVS